MRKSYLHQFPSPIGELHFSIDILDVLDEMIESFRPLSGSYISQFIMVLSLHSRPLFPSPIGELHFSMVILKWTITVLFVSVPYRGATFLNIIMTNIRINASRFRPLSGSYISQLCKHHSSVFFYSFRPLSGSYISQWNELCFDCCIWVSVPYRGATFLNTISATPCPVWDE